MDDATCIIDGREVEAPAAFEVLDPSTGTVLARVARGGAEPVDAAVRAARAASPGWSRTSPAERGAALRRLGELIARDREELALLESQDTGKPLTQARADADVAARYFSFYAGAIETFTGDTLPTGPDLVAFTRPVPFGVTGHIMPWNYPMQIACRTLAPSLAVEAGLPAGVLNVVPGLGEEAGAALARHPGIDHLPFTGSVQVGVSVTKAAADNVVPVARELGGKSPNVVLPDADIALALPVIATSILQSAGQTCSAGSRLLVHEAVHAEVVDELARVLGGIRIGPGPADPDLGPLISARQLDRVEQMVGQAARTSNLRLGSAERHTGAGEGGFYFGPVIADDVAPGDAIAQDEVFGPVVAVTAFADLDEAVRLANGTDYGLIAAVWTSDLGTAHRLTDEIHAGQVYVNTYGAGGGVEFPFGGFKKSGYGREKGAEALRAFCQTKTVVLKVTA